MGFIRAALSSGLNSFNDSKFKEAIVLPNNLTADALAIKRPTSFKRSRWQI